MFAGFFATFMCISRNFDHPFSLNEIRPFGGCVLKKFVCASNTIVPVNVAGNTTLKLTNANESPLFCVFA